MTRPKAITISRPYDARHVSGASIPGTENAVAKAFVDESISKFSGENRPPPPLPKRSHTFSHPSPDSKVQFSFRISERPLLNTKTSMPQLPRQPPVPPERANTISQLPKTAIDLSNVPKDQRPLGFKEIMAVKSFSERMALYNRTREYWAHADHGLSEWVGKATYPRPVV